MFFLNPFSKKKKYHSQHNLYIQQFYNKNNKTKYTLLHKVTKIYSLASCICAHFGQRSYPHHREYFPLTRQLRTPLVCRTQPRQDCTVISSHPLPPIMFPWCRAVGHRPSTAMHRNSPLLESVWGCEVRGKPL